MTLPLIFLVGPTAIGKSDLAIKLAKKIDGEIINADSMQVYNNLSILTARPSYIDQKNVNHHLYGYIDASVRYNVAMWCNDVTKIIENNNKKNIYSIIVGGTGMYIDKLINGLLKLPSMPESIKNDSEKILLEKGIKKFSREVEKIDKHSFQKISINDTMRLRRIWEIYQYTHKPLSHWLKNKNKKYINNQKYLIYLFTPNREKIYHNINDRFLKMIDSGAIDEVKKLKKFKLNSSLPIMRAHGVPEILKYLSKSISLDECIAKGQQVTRNYAKRQLTWWRSSKLDICKQFEDFPSQIDQNLLKF